MQPTNTVRTDSAAAKPKRPRTMKTSEACTSCRKVKTRCEPPLASGQPRCHRCTVLFLPCSLEDSPILAPLRAAQEVVNPSSSVNSSISGGLLEDELSSGLRGTPSSSPFDGIGLTPEELVCCPPNGPDLIHWIAEPMAPMHKLVSRSPRTLAPPDIPAFDIGTLSNEEIYYLRDIFKKHYTPWLNLPEEPPLQIPPSLDNPVTLAQCAVASRHLPPDVFGAAQPKLQQMVESSILVHLSDVSRSPSVEAVHALMILSLWCPAVGDLAPSAHTGRTISKGAVEMALVLGLDKATDDAFWQRGETLEEGRRKELTYQVHLWSAVCSAELMLVLGTSREPLAARPPCSHRSLDSEALMGGGSTLVLRQLRLRVTAHVHRSTLRGLRLTCQDLDSFGAELQETLTELVEMRNDMLPFQATSPHEPMHMDVLLFLIYWDSLLLLLHGLTQVRLLAPEATTETFWLSTLSKQKVTFVSRLGTQVITVAQTLILTFLSIFDRCQAISSLHIPSDVGARNTSGANFSPPLSTAPDTLYAAVLMAASALLLTRYVVFTQFEKRHALTWVSTGALLSRLADSLDALSVTEQHAPRRAAAVVRELYRTWNENVVSQMVPEEGKPHAKEASEWTLPIVGLDLLLGRGGFPQADIRAPSGISAPASPGSGSDGAIRGSEFASDDFPLMGLDSHSQFNMPEEAALLRFFEGIVVPSADIPVFGLGVGGVDGEDSEELSDLPDSSIGDGDFWSSLMGSLT